MGGRTTLGRLAKIVRSKNAGPFLFCVDMFFPDAASYQRVRASDVLTKEVVSGLYGVSHEEIYGVFWSDTAMGIKVTILRRYPNGDPDARDVLSAQQHVPFLELEIP